MYVIEIAYSFLCFKQLTITLCPTSRITRVTGTRKISLCVCAIRLRIAGVCACALVYVCKTMACERKVLKVFRKVVVLIV